MVPVALAGTSGASYGGSQAGAVLRYALMPTSGLRPTVYARLSSALAAPQADREAALGLSVRPIAGLPIDLLAETRVTRSGTATLVRPAVAAVAGLSSRNLPLVGEGEIYAQGGYVAGAGSTPFFDVQATVARPVEALAGIGAIRWGAGLWAGGQRGSARLDIGPRVSALVGTHGVFSRIALDWRVRVAGNAQPGSGPALTLSAGF